MTLPPKPTFGGQWASKPSGNQPPQQGFLGAQRPAPPIANQSPAKPSFGGHRPGAPAPNQLAPRQPASPKSKLLKTITAVKAVDQISGGGAHPVWLVATGSGDKFIVKDEALIATRGASSNLGSYDRNMAMEKARVAATSQVMSIISPGATTEVLDLSELQALEMFWSSPDSMKSSVRETKAGLTVLTKMVFDPAFFATKVDETERMSVEDKFKARTLFFQLRDNKEAWSSLGEVVLTDYLIGNADRIVADEYNEGKWIVANMGNLVFARGSSGVITRALGYDFIDPSARGSSNIYGQDVSGWASRFGRYISTKAKFSRAGVQVIDDINKKRMRPLGLADYGKDEANYFVQGMNSGWDKHASAIRTQVASGKGIASGLMARARYLGWVR